MPRMRVWAPQAGSVELQSGNYRVSMTPEHGAWWAVDAPFIRHGLDYTLWLDGEGPFPDPRSLWQPHGINGPSRWVDHAQFAWTDAGWQPPPLASAVIYELHVGTFTSEGSFEAIIDRLNHLVNLGVTHVELMPVAEFSGVRGWGYDGVDLHAPHHAYGGPEGLKRLVNACHQYGLAVLLDVVYNHVGIAGNYLERFGPYFTERYATPWGKAVNLDGRYSHEVRRFLIDNALMWLRDYHIDGLRIDAVHAIVDTSAIHFLEQLAAEVKKLESHLGRHLVLIAESDLNDPRLVRPVATGGYGLDAQWNEDFHHALHAVLTGESSGYYGDFGKLSDLAKALTEGFVYDGCYSAYRCRCHGRPAAGLSGRHFVGCLQNHDQVGNRARGERSSHLLTVGQLKVGAALVLTAPFTPMLFQGEEWGAASPFLYFTNHEDPELGKTVRRGRQEEFKAFGWKCEDIADPQAEQTFSRSKLNWAELENLTHAELLEWYRALIKLRRRLPSLTDGQMETTRVYFDEKARWMTVVRGNVMVACNIAERAQRLPCPGAVIQRILLASDPEIAIVGNEVSLPGHAVAVLNLPAS